MNIKHNGMNTVSNSRKYCGELRQFTKKDHIYIYIYTYTLFEKSLPNIH